MSERCSQCNIIFADPYDTRYVDRHESHKDVCRDCGNAWMDELRIELEKEHAERQAFLDWINNGTPVHTETVVQ